MILGGACPTGQCIVVRRRAEIGTEFISVTAREMGVANLGGAGSDDGGRQAFRCSPTAISCFMSVAAAKLVDAGERRSQSKPAWFYMNSVPAGVDIPAPAGHKAEGKPLDLGDERPRQQAHVA
jgi:4-deoxy-L-threo-5-hexosulose-uronate ketol-isomerase